MLYLYKMSVFFYFVHNISEHYLLYGQYKAKIRPLGESRGQIIGFRHFHYVKLLQLTILIAHTSVTQVGSFYISVMIKYYNIYFDIDYLSPWVSSLSGPISQDLGIYL